MPITRRDCPHWTDIERGIFEVVPRERVRCPECGYPLHVEEDVETLNPMTGERWITPAVAICNDCGFVHTFEVAPKESAS